MGHGHGGSPLVHAAPFSVRSVRLSRSRKGGHRRAGAIMSPIDLPAMFVRPAGDLLASFNFRGDRSRRMLREDEGIACIMCPCSVPVITALLCHDTKLIKRMDRGKKGWARRPASDEIIGLCTTCGVWMHHACSRGSTLLHNTVRNGCSSSTSTCIANYLIHHVTCVFMIANHRNSIYCLVLPT